jgi:hypothetical protein
MREPNIVVRRDGCTFCCLPLLVVLAAVLLIPLAVILALLMH